MQECEPRRSAASSLVSSQAHANLMDSSRSNRFVERERKGNSLKERKGDRERERVIERLRERKRERERERAHSEKGHTVRKKQRRKKAIDEKIKK